MAKKNKEKGNALDLNKIKATYKKNSKKRKLGEDRKSDSKIIFEDKTIEKPMVDINLNEKEWATDDGDEMTNKISEWFI